MIKILLLVITLLGFISKARGQIVDQSVVYKYDKAGNRYLRKIYTIPLRNAIKDSSVTSSQDIKVYPNPATEVINISFYEPVNEMKAVIKLYDMTGNLLLEKNSNTKKNDINITQHPTGIYILNIFFDQKNTQWKIIKE